MKMKRTILFRGKAKNITPTYESEGTWVYGLLGCNYFRPNEKYYYIHNCETDDIEYEVIPETVGQFTGLTDKNGKKIFEGDIVKATISINDFSRDRVRQEGGIYKIEYHTKHCYFYLAKDGNNLLFDGNWHYYLKNIQVIGNVHDNPELLETGE